MLLANVNLYFLADFYQFLTLARKEQKLIIQARRKRFFSIVEGIEVHLGAFVGPLNNALKWAKKEFRKMPLNALPLPRRLKSSFLRVRIEHSWFFLPNGQNWVKMKELTFTFSAIFAIISR